VVVVVVADSVVLSRLEMLMDLGSCRGDALSCVLGGLRGRCGAATAGRLLGVVAAALANAGGSVLSCWKEPPLDRGDGY